MIEAKKEAGMILFYDCFSGISGDMNLAAFLDAGLPEDYLLAELKKINMGPFEIKIRREKRGGIEGTRLEVITTAGDHPHRTLPQISHLVEESGLQEAVKSLALKIFHILAEAEAKVHGTTKDQVHFHEIGALDSIVDIIGAAIALDYFQPRLILSSPVELGSGIVHCSHGVFPVPAPATLEILKGIPVTTGGQVFEATTPTGAAILKATVGKFTESIRIKPRLTGYGIGLREGTRPNVLRIIMGEERTEEVCDTEVSSVVLMETNIDDMTPEETGHLLEILLSQGAQDVYLTPIIMKKTRPAVKISVLCDETLKEKMAEIIFLHSSTFGLRFWHLTKAALKRETSWSHTLYGSVPVKKGIYRGKIVKIKPEYDECRKLAEKNGIAIKKVLDEVKKNEQS